MGSWFLANRHQLGLVLGDKSQDLGGSAGARSTRTVGLRSENGVRWSAAWQADLTDHFLLFRDLGPPRLHPGPGTAPHRTGPARQRGGSSGLSQVSLLLTSEPGPTEGEACAEAQHVQTLRWTY